MQYHEKTLLLLQIYFVPQDAKSLVALYYGDEEIPLNQQSLL